jgi:anti-sigma regulatory factor (Ser/Thr protein kinase)
LEFRASFPGTSAGARAARHFVRDALRTSDLQFRYKVQLLVSELATNSALHTGDTFEVGIEFLESGGVRVAVTDDNPHVPQRRLAPLDATTGRGLNLVDALASVWGVDDHGRGKVVWFEVHPGVSPRAE